jgi:hypothetical protein
MEEQFSADHAYLHRLLRRHPEWTTVQSMTATGRSRSWVKKWRYRWHPADPNDDKVLQGHSRARQRTQTHRAGHLYLVSYFHRQFEIFIDALGQLAKSRNRMAPITGM